MLALAFLIAAVLRWRNEVDKRKWEVKGRKNFHGPVAKTTTVS